MTGYMRSLTGDDYRLVFYNGKKWARVRNNGFWGEVGKGWTNVEHTTAGNRFNSVVLVPGL